MIFNSKRKSKSANVKKIDASKMLTADSTFSIKEAYNAIRSNLLFTQKGEKCPIFVITSPTANNGKTINSINLAISFAQMGKKTLLIDADMRNPTIHRVFSIPTKNGLSEILAGLTDNVSVATTDVENLSILTAGKIPPNPTELLSSERMDKLLSFVREHYDCVFIDTPPINIVTDSTSFAGKTTGYIIIVKTESTDIGEVKTAVSNIEKINGTILGFVTNDTSSKTNSYHYKNRYGYYYDNSKYGK